MRKEEDRKFLPQSIFTYALPDLPELLRQAQQDAAVVQELVLMDILKDAGNTQIGEKYGFSHIGSIEEYRRRVPVSEYADYAEYTEQLKQGEKDVLFAGKADSFAITTGTTGKPKYIPESKKGAMVKAIVGNMRTMEMLRMLPGIMLPQIKILAIVNSAVYSKTEGGIEAGAASGKAVADAPLTAKSVFPVEVLGLSDLSTEAMDYLTLLFGVSERHVGGLICNNLIHFKRLFDRLNAAPGQIIADIRRGEVSLKLPEQARRNADSFFKRTGEVIDIGVSHHLGDCTDGQHGGQKQMLGFADPPVNQIIDRGNSHLHLNDMTQIIRADKKLPGQNLQRQRKHVVIVNIMDDLFRQVAGLGCLKALRQIADPVVHKGKDRTDRMLADVVRILAGGGAGVQDQAETPVDKISGPAHWNHRGQIVRDDLVKGSVF